MAKIIDDAIEEIDEVSTQGTDGKWLEYLTVRVVPHLKEWGLDGAWSWGDWSEREERFPGTTSQDIGCWLLRVGVVNSDPLRVPCGGCSLEYSGHDSE